MAENDTNINQIPNSSGTEFNMAEELIRRISSFTSSFLPELKIIPQMDNRLISMIVKRIESFLPHYNATDAFMSGLFTVPEYLLKWFNVERGLNIGPLPFLWFDPMRVLRPWLFQDNDTIDEDTFVQYQEDVGLNSDALILYSKFNRSIPKTGKQHLFAGLDLQGSNRDDVFKLSSDLQMISNSKSLISNLILPIWTIQNEFKNPQSVNDKFADKIIRRMIQTTGSYNFINFPMAINNEMPLINPDIEVPDITISGYQQRINNGSFSTSIDQNDRHDSRTNEINGDLSHGIDNNISTRSTVFSSGSPYTEITSRLKPGEEMDIAGERVFPEISPFKPDIEPEIKAAKQYYQNKSANKIFKTSAFSNVGMPLTESDKSEQRETISESESENREFIDTGSALINMGGQRSFISSDRGYSNSPVEPTVVNNTLSTLISGLYGTVQSYADSFGAIPELALAPVMRQAAAGETANNGESSTSSDIGAEDTSADVDTEQLATEVYGILKRRLLIEHERLQGIVR
jgi:hypothetical protein